MDSMEHIRQIKSRIRYLREALETSPEQLAYKLGFTESQYLEYEQGEGDIPAGVIYDIAAALGVDPTELLIGESPRMTDYTVTRKGCGIAVERFPGYSFEALAYNFVGRNKVIEGKVAVIIGNKTVTLNAGDCIYFNPAIEHGQYAVGGRAVFLTLIDS